MSEHWGPNPRDTYLGMVYVCSSCGWRLTECKCPPDPPGWNFNRYAQGVDAGLYELGPITYPLAFVTIDAQKDDAPQRD